MSTPAPSSASVCWDPRTRLRHPEVAPADRFEVKRPIENPLDKSRACHQGVASCTREPRRATPLSGLCPSAQDNPAAEKRRRRFMTHATHEGPKRSRRPQQTLRSRVRWSRRVGGTLDATSRSAETSSRRRPDEPRTAQQSCPVGRSQVRSRAACLFPVVKATSSLRIAVAWVHSEVKTYC